MSTRPEIFVGHVTEPELATRLEVSIGSPCLRTFLSFIRNRSRRVVSDYCERGQRYCVITLISSTLGLQLLRGITLQFTRPTLSASSPRAGRLPLYGPHSSKILLPLFILSPTSGMEILSSASTLHPFVCEVLTCGSRWVDDPPNSVETIQGRVRLAIRATSIIFKEQDVG